MAKETIHFAPGNSFPALAYKKLFSFLEDDFEIGFLNLHAHNPRFPVTDGWKCLAQELKEEIERRYTKPVIGVGHSLGGILHFLVAVEHPELYRAIVLLDAPLMSRLSGVGIKLAKTTGLIDKLSPYSVAVKRRNEWRSKREAFEHFRRKFRSFDVDSVSHYVEHATVANDEGKVKLLFKPEIEAEIYRTLPDDFAQYRGKLRVPAGYIGGTNSKEARMARLAFMKRHFPFKFHFLSGSHHIPFQKPEETALAIKEMIHRITT